MNHTCLVNPQFFPCAVFLNDLHAYDPASKMWTDLSAAASGAPPSPRVGHGLASAGGRLFVHCGGNSGGAAAVYVHFFNHGHAKFQKPLALVCRVTFEGDFRGRELPQTRMRHDKLGEERLEECFIERNVARFFLAQP